MRGRLTGGVAVVAAVVIAGCGSSNFGHESGSKILSAAASAARSAKSYTASGTLTEGGQPMQIQLNVQEPSSVSADVITGADQFKLIVTKNTPYIWANAAYWRKETSGAAAKLADDFAGKWFKTTAAQVGGLGSEFKDMGPSMIAECVIDQMPDPHVGATTTVNGTTVVPVSSTSSKHHATLWIATSSPHYVVKLITVGSRPAIGGACGNSPGSSAGNLTLTGWNATTVSAPSDAVTLP